VLKHKLVKYTTDCNSRYMWPKTANEHDDLHFSSICFRLERKIFF